MAKSSGLITAWSYSRWADYERCPFYAKLKHVDRLKEPDNKYQARGSAIHKLAEDYASGKIRTIPFELKTFSEEFKKLKKMKPIVECSWAFDVHWQPSSWFDTQRTWVRIKVDVTVAAKGKRFIIDHKTGKDRPEHEDQLGLYAIGGFLSHPEDEQECQDWYLDKLQNDPEKITGADFTRDMLPQLQEEWLHKTGPMLSDKMFKPKPSDKCRFCHFRKENGGPCKF